MMTVTVCTGRDSGCLYDGCHSVTESLPEGIQAVTVFTGRNSGCLYDDCHSVYWQGFRMSV